MAGFIWGPRYKIPVNRIVTPRFTKDISRLRTYKCDIRKLLTDHRIKDRRLELMQGLIVNVVRTELLAMLRKNREKYVLVQREAAEGYKMAVLTWLRNTIRAIDDGDLSVSLSCPHRMPEDHTEEYDNAIGMLEAAVDDKIALTAQQFAAFGRNQWDWMQDFKMSSMMYARSAATL